MSRGWFGNRHQHSLASKGIRVKARGVQLENTELFPHSYQATSFGMLKISFDREGNDVLLIPTESLVQKITAYAKRHNLKVENREGEIVPMEAPSVRMMMMLNPEAIKELAQYVFNKEVSHWISVPTTEKVTEYYPSLVGMEVEIKHGDKTGKIISEEIKVSDSIDFGDDTEYTIEFDDGNVETGYHISSIGKINGKDIDKVMVYKESESISRHEEENL